jgi:hypothetical protein
MAISMLAQEIELDNVVVGLVVMCHLQACASE